MEYQVLFQYKELFLSTTLYLLSCSFYPPPWNCSNIEYWVFNLASILLNHLSSFKSSALKNFLTFGQSIHLVHIHISIHLNTREFETIEKLEAGKVIYVYIISIFTNIFSFPSQTDHYIPAQ